MKVYEEEIKIKHKLLKKHIPIESKILTKRQENILNEIEMYIKYAYNNSNFDLEYNERLIINLSNGILFISDNENIIYKFDKSNPCVTPMINFLLNRGFCHGTYASLHGFKYMYRLLAVLDELDCISA